MKPASAITSWPLLVLGLASCQSGPPIDDETGETGETGSTTDSGELDGSTSLEADGTATDPGAEPSCGNGVVEAGEECDAVSFSSTCDDDCTLVACGDGLINPIASEQCEGTDLGGATCSSEGLAGGTLACGDDCRFDASECEGPPGAPVPTLGYSQVKQFDFGWPAVTGAAYYRLLESRAPGEPFEPLDDDIVGDSLSIAVPLYSRQQASYVLHACNDSGCTESSPIHVEGSLATAVGYFKASNTGAVDLFGQNIVLSEDGRTLVVAAPQESSGATGIGGDQANDSAYNSGAVYVFVRDSMDQWSQQAYIKPSNTDAGDFFGASYSGRAMALSSDGNTLAVGAYAEASSATGVGGNQADDSAFNAGAVYVFVRDADQWSQQAYVKASNTDANDSFGGSVALSSDGNTLAVGASGEASSATGIGGNQASDSATGAGAVYVLERDAAGQWSQQAYVKASNTDADDQFGWSLALSGQGDTLVVGAPGEDGSAVGIDGDQASEAAIDAGAVYVFVRDAADLWSQQAYVKASNTDANDSFGRGVALSDDGNTVAVGAPGEASSAPGIGGDEGNDALESSGAAYVLVRDARGQWSQQAYIKASNPGMHDTFGGSIALSDDGRTLAVAAQNEGSDAVGIDGDQANDAAEFSGAVYVFAQDATDQWSQQAYVKASNTGSADDFGWMIALSGDGNTLAVGSPYEDSGASGIGGNQSDFIAATGAVYLY